MHYLNVGKPKNKIYKNIHVEREEFYDLKLMLMKTSNTLMQADAIDKSVKLAWRLELGIRFIPCKEGWRS